MLMLVFFVTINFKICKVCNTLAHLYYPLLWSLCSKQMSQTLLLLECTVDKLVQAFDYSAKPCDVGTWITDN